MKKKKEIPLDTRYFMTEMTQEEYEYLANKREDTSKKEYKFNLINREPKDERPNP